MNKQQLIDKVNELDASQGMKDRLLSRLSIYGEELDVAQQNDFENYLTEVIRDEELASALLEKAANHLDTGLQKVDLDLAAEMEDIANQAEQTNAQLKDLAAS